MFGAVERLAGGQGPLRSNLGSAWFTPTRQIFDRKEQGTNGLLGLGVFGCAQHVGDQLRAARPGRGIVEPSRKRRP